MKFSYKQSTITEANGNHTIKPNEIYVYEIISDGLELTTELYKIVIPRKSNVETVCQNLIKKMYAGFIVTKDFVIGDPTENQIDLLLEKLL